MMLRSNPGYQDIKAPTTLNHRYLWEDIPTGLVPISDMARALDIETPTIDGVIDEGSRIILHQIVRVTAHPIELLRGVGKILDRLRNLLGIARERR